nr:hypothetical protein [uncultured Prevotella sp.]
MKQKIVLTIMAMLAFSTNILAQSNLPTTKTETSSSKNGKITQSNDSIFKAHLVNDEFQVWMVIDFYHNNITVPRQEIFGEVPGYFGAVRDTRKWIISDAVIKGKKALLTIINDYGSEDLKAELKRNSDGTYTLTRLSGSTMKIVVDNKWVKIPKDITFYVKQKR